MEYLDFVYNRNQIEILTKQFARLNIKSEHEFYEKFYDIYQLDYRIIYKKTSWEKAHYQLLHRYYRNEYVIKSAFVHQKLIKSSAVCFEELPIFKSRIDLFSINGKSIAYEIKTKYDKLNRIKKQTDDYSKCFEYVYVICPYERLDAIKNIISKHIGIYCYYPSSTNISFFEKRKAMLSPYLKASNILSNLNCTQLQTMFNTKDKKYILKKYTKNEINQKFKKILKLKFNTKSQDLKHKIIQLYL